MKRRPTLTVNCIHIGAELLYEDTDDFDASIGRGNMQRTPPRVGAGIRFVVPHEANGYFLFTLFACLYKCLVNITIFAEDKAPDFLLR